MTNGTYRCLDSPTGRCAGGQISTDRADRIVTAAFLDKHAAIVVGSSGSEVSELWPEIPIEGRGRLLGAYTSRVVLLPASAGRTRLRDLWIEWREVAAEVSTESLNKERPREPRPVESRAEAFRAAEKAAAANREARRRQLAAGYLREWNAFKAARRESEPS